MNPKVDSFMSRTTQWHEEFGQLRRILLGCSLNEDLKWGQPCYDDGGNNIVLIHGFKEYCAVLFMNGALLKDPAGILVIQTKNVQAARQIRYTSVAEVLEREQALKAYVAEAVDLSRSGQKVEFKKTTEFEVPEEFQIRLQGDNALKEAFAALTPGRQRAYLLHFSQPKQAKTREARVEKFIPKILDGLGFDD